MAFFPPLPLRKGLRTHFLAGILGLLVMVQSIHLLLLSDYLEGLKVYCKRRMQHTICLVQSLIISWAGRVERLTLFSPGTKCVAVKLTSPICIHPPADAMERTCTNTTCTEVIRHYDFSKREGCGSHQWRVLSPFQYDRNTRKIIKLILIGILSSSVPTLLRLHQRCDPAHSNCV